LIRKSFLADPGDFSFLFGKKKKGRRRRRKKERKEKKKKKKAKTTVPGHSLMLKLTLFLHSEKYSFQKYEEFFLSIL
jgi:hypothetical protein